MNVRPNNNNLITYCQPVCYFLKNTTIPCKENLQYPVNTTYNNRIMLMMVLSLSLHCCHLCGRQQSLLAVWVCLKQWSRHCLHLFLHSLLCLARLLVVTWKILVLVEYLFCKSFVGGLIVYSVKS